MTDQQLRNQELGRHEEKVDRNIEHHQAVNLEEKTRGIQAANQNSTVARIVNIVYFLFGIVELLLAVRVILHLVGANADNGFASFIYGLSSPFVALFSSLLQNPVLSPTATLEITTLIAMVVWAIVAWLVGRSIWLVMSRPR
ncbi:MAG TPA: YggT family protein [Phototrophicaceae bacterium]|nr:YggT family protein [Phototrophicaceae bacterium]